MTSDSAVVFLDRDGTLNVDTGYHCDPDTLELIPGAAHAVARLKRAGYRVVIISNQSAIGRGIATEEQVKATNAKLLSLLAQADAQAVIDDVLFCPHEPAVGCDCRKPGIGLVVDELRTGAVDPEASWVIGDKLGDLSFGANAGIPFERRLLVLTGEGEAHLKRAAEQSGFNGLKSFPSIGEAAEWIAAQSAKRS